MKILISVFSIVLFVCPLIFMTGQGCSQIEKSKINSDSVMLASSPVLSAQAAIDKMHIEDGFEIKLVAQEP